MADKRISQLVERTDIANNDVVPIVASGATTTNKATISSIQEFMQENLDLGVTSVGITLGTTGTDVNVTGSPITTSGNITINIPNASATARGVVSTGTQTFAGVKTFNSDIIVNGVNVGRGGSSVPSNTRIGNSALQDNTSGGNNTAVGFASLIFTTTGSSNTAIGHQVLSNNNGSLNTGVGISSLFNLTTGSNNLGLGNQAGNQISGGANHTTSNNSIFIGSDTKPAANNQTNQIVIGHQSVGQGSNTVTIGNSDITSNKLFGRVIHADAVNADESATLGQVSTSLGGYVTLGTPQTITGQKTFNSTIVGQDSTLTSSGSNPTLLVTHSSGSGIALDISKGGNGEGLRVTKTSGSGNAVTITGGALSAEAGQFSGDVQTATRFAASSGSNGITITPNVGGTQNRIETTGSLPLSLVSAAAITMAAGGTTPQITLATTGAVTLTGAITLSNNQNAPTTISISNTTAGTGSQSTFSALSDSNAGVANFGKYSSLTTPYKILGSSSAFIYTDKGNISILNDNTSGSILLAAGGSATAHLTLASTGAATFSSSVTADGSRMRALDFFSFGSLNDTDGSFLIDHPGVQTWKIGITNANTSTFSIGNDNGGSFAAKYFNITNGGNVGIGTASPSARLDIVSTGTGSEGLRIDGAGGGFAFVVRGGSTYTTHIRAGATIGESYFTTPPVNGLIVQGNVGIGTASPEAILHVNKSTAGGEGGYIYIDNPASSTLNSSVGIRFSTSTGGSFAGVYTGNIANIVTNASDGSSALTFGTFDGSTSAERMRITSGGNVLIGTQTAANFGANRTTVQINGADGSGYSTSYNGALASYIFSSSAGTDIVEARNLYMSFATNALERMRITSAGTVLVGVSDINSSAMSAFVSGYNGIGSKVSNNAFYLFSGLNTSDATTFFVLGNGDVRNTNNSYGAISDIKLKENIEDATPKLDDLLKVKIRNYNLIGDDKKQIGVIAQELEEVFPLMVDELEDFEEVEVPQLDEEGNEVLNEDGELVTTKQRVSKGTTTKSVKYSVFVPMLIKAIQEQQEQIQELKTEIDSLKNQIKTK